MDLPDLWAVPSWISQVLSKDLAVFKGANDEKLILEMNYAADKPGIKQQEKLIKELAEKKGHDVVSLDRIIVLDEEFLTMTSFYPHSRYPELLRLKQKNYFLALEGSQCTATAYLSVERLHSAYSKLFRKDPLQYSYHRRENYGRTSKLLKIFADEDTYDSIIRTMRNF